MHAFPAGTEVEFIAATETGAFLGWSDACSGFGRCVLTADADKSVGALFGIRGQALWVQHAGASGDDETLAIARDGNDHLIVAGRFRGTIQLGGALTSAGGSDIFVAKLDASTGGVVWAKRFGGPADDEATAIAVDDQSNVYVAGTFSGSVNFGAGQVASSGNSDGFAMRLDATGGFTWAHKMGGTAFDLGTGIAVRSGLVVTVGNFQGSMSVAGTPLNSAGGSDIYAIGFSTTGTLSWAKRFGGTALDDPKAVAIDPAGNVVIAGRFSGTTNLGGQPLTSAGQDDVFVAKYTGSTGAHLFSKRFGAAGFDQTKGMSVDADNAIVLMGLFVGTVDVGGPEPLTTPSSGMFVVKLSVAGAHQWSRAFPFEASTSALIGSAATSDFGDVAITGSFCGTVNFGGTDLSSVGACNAGDRDVFAARFAAADGAHLNSIRAGGTALDVGHGVAQLADGRTFVAGGFQGFAEFGGEALTSAGGYDLVVLAFAPL